MTGRLQVLPGAGTVLRFGDVVIWAGPSASGALLSFLSQSAHNVADSPHAGPQIVDHIAGILVARDPEPGAPFAVVGHGPGGWITLLHGPVQLWDGTRWLAPTPQPGWLRSDVAPRPALSVGPAGSPSPRLVMDSPYDLRAGTVPGGGLILIGDPAPSAGPAAAGQNDRAVPSSPRVPTPGPAVAPFGLPPTAVPPAAVPPAAVPPAAVPPAAVPGGPPLAMPPVVSPVGEPADRTTSLQAIPDGVPDAGGTVIDDLPVDDAAGPSDPGTVIDTGDDLGAPPAGTVIDTGDDLGAPAAGTVIDTDPVASGGGTGLTAGARSAGTAGDGGPPGAGTALTRPAAATSWVDLSPTRHPALAPLPPGPAPVPVGRPEVAGIRCERGHFNHPAARRCGVCGRPVPPGQTPSLGPRPALGLLIADDGGAYRVDADQVIGADPRVDEGVVSGRLRGVPLTGTPGQLAPVHAELRLTDWTVSVVDRGSAGGTFVVAAGTTGWTRLTPYQPVAIRPGSHLSVGQRVLTFVSPWPG